MISSCIIKTLRKHYGYVNKYCFKEEEIIKRVIIVAILLIMMPITSCSKEEIIKLNLTDQIITITELIDKSLEIDYENAVVSPILFTNNDEYEKFAKQFFKGCDERL